MGDDQYIADVVNEGREKKAGPLERLIVWTLGMAICGGFWWVIIWGVALAIDMGRR